MIDYDYVAAGANAVDAASTLLVILVPTAVNAVTVATAISPAISAYSMAVAPRLLAARFFKKDITNSNIKQQKILGMKYACNF
jgi:hypothetical protein